MTSQSTPTPHQHLFGNSALFLAGAMVVLSFMLPTLFILLGNSVGLILGCIGLVAPSGRVRAALGACLNLGVALVALVRFLGVL